VQGLAVSTFPFNTFNPQQMPGMNPEGQEFPGFPPMDMPQEENPQEEDAPLEQKQDFYANLAEDMDKSVLKRLATQLLENIENDDSAREGWLKTINVGLRYLGWKVEESRNTPFMNACSAYDTSMSTALINAYSVIYAELFPASGPARSEIIGIPTQETEDQGERVKLFINNFLTNINRDYYPDSRTLVMYVVFCGSGFRKVYQDPILNQPDLKFIKPQDFIVNPNTTSLMSSDRMSHKVFLSRKDVMLRQLSGEFVEDALPAVIEENQMDKKSIQKTIEKMDGVQPDTTENKSLFIFYETHVDLTDEDINSGRISREKSSDELPKPYIVMICEVTKTIVSIKRNWKEGDNTYHRAEYFVPYMYLPGFGIYGTGLAHLMGSNSIVLSNVLRQLMDAGTLKNFPGGLKVSGLKIETNDLAIGPAEFREIETGGLPIQQCVMLMPYAEPSTVLMQLRTDLMMQSAKNGMAADVQVPELGTNAPVGTTLSMIEVNGRAQSTVLRSFRNSLSHELKLLFNLFGDHLEDKPYTFSVPGKETAIMRADFNEKVNIVPVSDPNVLTSTHRLLRAEAIYKIASSAPQIYNMREINKMMLHAMNVDNIDKLLIEEPQPVVLDAMSENMNILAGKPVMVNAQQDHKSHKPIHTAFALEMKQSGNLASYASAIEHEQMHKAMEAAEMLIQQKVHQQVQQQIESGQIHPAFADKVFEQMHSQAMQQLSQTPAPQLLQDMEIQNAVSKMDAEELAQQQQQMQQQQQQIQELQQVPNKIMMEDINQRKEAAHLKNDETKLKVEEDAFKAQLHFESEKAKLEAQKDMATDKHLVDIAIAEMKQNPTRNPEGY
jgi:hypothetical protein